MHSHRLSIAPMLDWTDRHARYFLRLISPHARMYTEMITTGAIIYNANSDRFLAFSPEENPIALQLGGSNLDELAKACQIAESYAYDEINLNIGCPSDRVQSGRFGACLMADPKHVAECFKVMQDNSSKLITIKCRTGVDDLDTLAHLEDFININYQAGCRYFIIHARKAWLSGLSPKENRDIPPLHYERVYHIKKLFADANIMINGGISTAAQSLAHVKYCDGVMIGREAYQNPYSLIAQEQALFNTQDLLSRHQIACAMLPYIQAQLAEGAKLNHITRHMIGLFKSAPGGKQYRRHLSENAHKANAGISVLEDALAYTLNQNEAEHG